MLAMLTDLAESIPNVSLVLYCFVITMTDIQFHISVSAVSIQCHHFASLNRRLHRTSLKSGPQPATYIFGK